MNPNEKEPLENFGYGFHLIEGHKNQLICFLNMNIIIHLILLLQGYESLQFGYYEHLRERANRGIVVNIMVFLMRLFHTT